MSPTFRSLHNRNYRLYASGAVVSNVGTWMQRVAQDWLVLQLTHNSGTALGITTGLQFLPILLLSPYAGLVADRFSKRRLLQVTQTMLAVPALLLGLLAVTGVAQTWQVFALAFVFGIGSAFDAPTRQSFVSEIVGQDDLTNAVGLNSASFNLARMIGPALAGLLIAALGSGVQATGAVILVNAVSYGAVILSLQRMRESELQPSVRAGRHRGMIREGVRYTLRRPDLMMILTIVFFAGTFGLNFQITSALMATEVFHKGAGEYGLLGTTLAIGSLSGALLAARRGRIRHRLVIAAAGIFGLAEVVGGPDALLRRVRGLDAGHRDRVADADHLRERQLPDERRPDDAGTRDGALHDGLHGRHPDRRADRGLGRPDLRAPLDARRRRARHRARHAAGGAWSSAAPGA